MDRRLDRHPCIVIALLTNWYASSICGIRLLIHGKPCTFQISGILVSFAAFALMNVIYSNYLTSPSNKSLYSSVCIYTEQRELVSSLQSAGKENTGTIILTNRDAIIKPGLPWFLWGPVSFSRSVDPSPGISLLSLNLRITPFFPFYSPTRLLCLARLYQLCSTYLFLQGSLYSMYNKGSHGVNSISFGLSRSLPYYAMERCGTPQRWTLHLSERVG